MVCSMLSESLLAVVLQTLVKKIGGGRIAAHEIMLGTLAIRNLDPRRQGGADVLVDPVGWVVGDETLDMGLKDLVTKGWSVASMRGEARSPDGF